MDRLAVPAGRRCVELGEERGRSPPIRPRRREPLPVHADEADQPEALVDRHQIAGLAAPAPRRTRFTSSASTSGCESGEHRIASPEAPPRSRARAATRWRRRGSGSRPRLVPAACCGRRRRGRSGAAGLPLGVGDARSPSSAVTSRGTRLYLVPGLCAEQHGAGAAGAGEPPVGGLEQVVVLGARSRARTDRSARPAPAPGRTAGARSKPPLREVRRSIVMAGDGRHLGGGRATWVRPLRVRMGNGIEVQVGVVGRAAGLDHVVGPAAAGTGERAAREPTRSRGPPRRPGTLPL